jgi:hypothetical protein
MFPSALPAVMPTVKAHNKATAKGGSKVSVPILSAAAVTDDEWGDEVAKDAPGPPAALSTLGRYFCCCFVTVANFHIRCSSSFDVNRATASRIAVG